MGSQIGHSYPNRAHLSGGLTAGPNLGYPKSAERAARHGFSTAFEESRNPERRRDMAHTTSPFGEFDSYREARATAQTFANRSGLSVGVEKPTAYQSWTTKLLPRPENRQGHELAIECVDPE